MTKSNKKRNKRTVTLAAALVIEIEDSGSLPLQPKELTTLVASLGINTTALYTEDEDGEIRMVRVNEIKIEEIK